MKNKLKLWKDHDSWEAAEAQWDHDAKNSAKKTPIKNLKKLPQMPGITQETAKNLKWKSFKYMGLHDCEGKIRKGFFTHPLRYGWSFLKSLWNKGRYIRDDDFFLFGIKSVDEFKTLLKDEESILIMGFSYCHKPFECPSKRFTTECIHDLENPVCQQCYIGKSVHALPEERVIPLFITTIHYIGGKVFEIAHANPGKKILFIITACELTLEMFSDWGNMVDISGIGVRLDGRICNTMKAFELSEAGTKPGLTVILEHTKNRILDLIRHRKESLS
jgi:hypothetical protein